MSSVVPLRSSSCQSPDLVLPRPFPSVLTTRAFDHSRRRWFGTCSCQTVPRGPPSSIKQLHTLGPPRPFALVAHWRPRSAPVWHSPTALVHRPDETACRTNAGTSSPVEVRSPRLAAFPVLSGSPYPVRHFLRPVPQLGSPTTSGSVSIRSGPPLASADKPSACHAESNRRKPRHTTHHQHFPERVTITRPHHPFEGQPLEVLRQARMPTGLQFVLILPDGRKSLIPADWTDFKHPSCAPQDSQLVGSLDDLLRLRGLVDALLRRYADLPVRSGTSQEGHAATESELQRYPDSGDAPVGAVRPRPKAGPHRDAGATPCQSDGGPVPGADQ